MPLVKTMVTMPAGQGYDLDPTRAQAQDLKQNQKNVEFVTSTFLEIVASSLPAFPP
jgi:neurofibromin 1